MLFLPLLHHLDEPLHHFGVLVGEDELVSVSRAAMAVISSAVRVKSKTFRFSAMRSLWVDLGITTTPRWMCQRSII